MMNRLAAVAVLTVLIASAAYAQVTPPDLTSPPADATKSSSGLISKMLTPGDGTEKVLPSDIITVHYTAWSSDGTMFDSSHTKGVPGFFPLNRTMLGWRECVQLMKLSETRRCWVPQNLAYNGQAGRPKGTIVFDIELLDTRRAPNVAPPDVKAPPEDAKRTVSGLFYKVLKPGTGVRKPGPFQRVTVHYTGWTSDGKMFDSSVARGMPATLNLDEVIKGWTEGMQMMVEGERTRFWIPENLAYKGEAPKGMLVFDVDLIKIQ